MLHMHKGCPPCSCPLRGWRHPCHAEDTRTSVCPQVMQQQLSAPWINPLPAQKAAPIKCCYSRAKLLLFHSIHDFTDVPGNAKGLLFPTAKVPVHDGGRNLSPTLPLAGAGSAWSRSAPAAPRLEKAGASWAYSVRATRGKENHTDERRGRVVVSAWSPITLHHFASWKQDTAQRSCALSDLQTQCLHEKPHEVFFSTEAVAFIGNLSNIQA